VPARRRTEIHDPVTGDLLPRLRKALGAQFAVERELGGGGMSRVFVATETALGRRVVIKLLTPELAAGVNVERFRREIQLAARLQHANIVPVLATGELDGLPWFTMPFVDGESLRARLGRGSVGVTEAVGLLRDVARALAFAHARGVAHRDIKPENILLAGGAAVVADFGIAKAISAARTEPGGMTLTQVGTSIGTPTYMSPEQAAGDVHADHRVDLYSFGVVAYELLAGRPPFTHGTPQKQLAAHLAEQPKPVGDLRPDVPPALATLVMRCLEKDADARPQTAEEIVRTLETVTSGSGAPAMPAILLGGSGMVRKALALWAASFVLVAVLAKAAIVGIGLPDWVFPGALIVMGLGLPVILFTAFVQRQMQRMLTATPQLTPGGTQAPQGTLATIAVKASPHVSWSRAAKGGAWAVGSFVAIVGVWMVMRALGIGPAATLLSAGKVDAKERIIVAEFRSPGDTLLGATVTDAFRTDLAQSSTLNVISSAVARNALRRMRLPDTTRVNEDVARQIAARDGMKAIITGEVVSLGGSYVLSARLVSALGNDELATFRETAAEARDIIPAIGRLSKAIRAKVGDNLRRVQAAQTLDKVTTPSLEALQKYVQAVRLIEAQNDWERGKPLLEEAIALDSGFAMAYRKLAMEESNRFGNASRIQALLQKAFDNRDRLTEDERLITDASYYMMGPHPDRNKVVAAYEQLLQRDPTNVTALNNVAIMYRDLHQYAKAEESARRAVAVQPTATVFFNNVFFNQVSQGKIAPAETTLRAMAAALPKNPFVLFNTAQLEWIKGNHDSTLALARALQADPAADVQRAGLSMGRRVAQVRGQLAVAGRYRQQLRANRLAAGVRSADIVIAIDEASDQFWFLNDKARALRTIDAALARTPLESLPMADRPYDDLAMFYARLGRPDRARQLLAGLDRRHEAAPSLYDETIRHDVVGLINIAEGKYDDAISELRQSTGDDCDGCREPDIALAFDLAGRPDSAIAAHERYLANKVFYRVEIDARFLAPTYKRLGELYEAKGSRAKAAEYYEKFVELWKSADPELQPQVRAVQEKLARLRRAGG
jgi:tetratricopeptide (TPR) repeat protein/tRNA A-37 threonylcarbamoyl transferase component Bud32